MHIDFLRKQFARYERSDALVWRDAVYSYGNLLQGCLLYTSDAADES